MSAKGRSGDAEIVKSCTDMCIILAKDGLTGSLLEKNLPESIAKLSSWLKSYVRESFTVEEDINSVRRKRQVPDNYYDYGAENVPPEYDMSDQVAVDDLVLDPAEQMLSGNYPEYEDSVDEVRSTSLSRRLHEPDRQLYRLYGRFRNRVEEEPKPASECLAKQQELLDEVLNVLDQIAEKAVEHLREMIRDEVEREMSEGALLTSPFWWIIVLQQNNLLIPYVIKEKNPREDVTYATQTPEAAKEVRQYARADPSHESTSRASAMAVAMSGPVAVSWYPQQTSNGQDWYPYQNQIPDQTHYPYQDSPSNQQTWYGYQNSPPSQGWYASQSSPDGAVQVALSSTPAGSESGQVYVQKEPEEATAIMHPPVDSSASADKIEESSPGAETAGPLVTTTRAAEVRMPETTPLFETIESLKTTSRTVEETTKKVPEVRETTPVMETTDLPKTTPKATEGRASETTSNAETTEVQKTTASEAPTGETTTRVPEWTQSTEITMVSTTQSSDTTTEFGNVSMPTEGDEIDAKTSDEGTSTTEVTTELPTEATIDVSSRALTRWSDDASTFTDCDTAVANRFLPAILEVFKLKSK